MVLCHGIEWQNGSVGILRIADSADIEQDHTLQKQEGMGRTLITKTLPGEMTKKQIEGEFERLSQAAAVASDYHDYSGSWNTFVEVDVVEKDRSGKGLVFESYEDAEDYVFRLSDEMGPVCLAVRVATRDKKRGQIVEWLMGGAALC